MGSPLGMRESPKRPIMAPGGKLRSSANLKWLLPRSPNGLNCNGLNEPEPLCIRGWLSSDGLFEIGGNDIDIGVVTPPPRWWLFILSSERASWSTGVLAVDERSWLQFLSTSWPDCKWWWCWFCVCTKQSVKLGKWLIIRFCIEVVNFERFDGALEAVELIGDGGGKSIKEECRQLLTISSPNIELNCSTFCKTGGGKTDGVDAGRGSFWFSLLLLLLLFNLLLIFLSCWIGVRISWKLLLYLLLLLLLLTDDTADPAKQIHKVWCIRMRHKFFSEAFDSYKHENI